MTAAAPRMRWAALWRWLHAPLRTADVPQHSNAGWLSLFAPLLAAGAVLLCAAIGFATTQISETRLEAAQHVALQRALDEFHAEFSDVDAPDDSQLRRIARRAGLGDLRFDA